MVDVRRNAGTLGGFLAITDNGEQIHVPSGRLGDMRAALYEASERYVVRKIGDTEVDGDHSDLIISDHGASARVSVDEARRLANAIGDYITQEAYIQDRGRRLK